MPHSPTIHAMYAAFGRGDIPSILAQLDPDVRWDFESQSPDIPWMKPRRGRAEVGGFFAALSDLQFERFEPKAVLEQGSLAVALLDITYTLRSTGKRVVEDDEVHLWRFGPTGLVTQFRHRVDTLAVWRAMQR